MFFFSRKFNASTLAATLNCVDYQLACRLNILIPNSGLTWLVLQKASVRISLLCAWKHFRIRRACLFMYYA